MTEISKVYLYHADIIAVMAMARIVYFIIKIHTVRAACASAVIKRVGAGSKPAR